HIFFFFQAEDGIRDKLVTGVQTCALPIWLAEFYRRHFLESRDRFFQWNGDLLGVVRRLRDDGCLEIMASAATHGLLPVLQQSPEIGRASCRERVENGGGEVSLRE